MIFLTNLTILTIFSPIGALESKCLSVGSSVCLSTLLIFLLYKSFVIYFDILWYVNMYYDICQLISLSIQRTWTFSWSIFTIFSSIGALHFQMSVGRYVWGHFWFIYILNDLLLLFMFIMILIVITWLDL